MARDLRYYKLLAHFIVTALVVAVVLRCFDGRNFNITSRRPLVTQADGTMTRTHLHDAVALQSDITTILGILATCTRIVAGWWAADIAWRCIFLLMRRGGLKWRGLTWIQVHAPPLWDDVRHTGLWILVSLILISTWVMDLSSSVLAGAVTWKPSSTLVTGHQRLGGIPFAASGRSLSDYRAVGEVDNVISQSLAAANLVWDTTGGLTTTMRRVLRDNPPLPINSTLTNITIPYFAVHTFEWVEDPDSILTYQQLHALSDHNPHGPYFASGDFIGLIPENGIWGPPTNDTLPAPHIVSETRLISIRVDRVPPDTFSCSRQSPNFGWIPEEAGFRLEPSESLEYSDCFVFLRINYTAGVGTCPDCQLLSAGSARFVQHNVSLTPEADALTSEALSLVSVIGTHMQLIGYATPPRRNNIGNYSIALLSRAYQAAWTILTTRLSSENAQLSTEVKINVLLSKASFQRWRVYAWAALNVSAMLLGLLFFLQENPPIDDPAVSALQLKIPNLPSEEVNMEGNQINTEGEAALKGRDAPFLRLQNTDS